MDGIGSKRNRHDTRLFAYLFNHPKTQEELYRWESHIPLLATSSMNPVSMAHPESPKLASNLLESGPSCLAKEQCALLILVCPMASSQGSRHVATLVTVPLQWIMGILKLNYQACCLKND